MGSAVGARDRLAVAIDVHFVTDPADPRLIPFCDIKDHALRAAGGQFVAESEGVVRQLLASRLSITGVLLTAPRLASLAPALPTGVPVYVVPQEVMDGVAGLHVHRGCLAVAHRPTTAHVPDGATTVVVLEDLVDVDNLGAIIRNAAGFGADAVVLSPRCADPYYRKAIRVSMGAVFTMPIVRHAAWPEDLLALRASHHLALVGAVLSPSAVPLHRYKRPANVALLLGSEGPGLRPETQALCDALITIPMAPGKADSLNVATAGAVCLYGLSVPWA